jgi:hypothetical protein
MCIKYRFYFLYSCVFTAALSEISSLRYKDAPKLAHKPFERKRA